MDKKKFKGKYRIESTRYKNYDYASNGGYFITIVTKDRQHFFGDIINGSMILNDIGKIAQKYWNEIPNHFPFIKLDEMVVMPNHIHGVLWIDKKNNSVDTPKLGVSTTKLGVSTTNLKSTTKLNTTTKRNKNHKIEWKPGTIGVVINQYKRICTIKSRKITLEFGWQSRFHDRIIRDTNELNRIQNYIIQNPEIWHRDRNK